MSIAPECEICTFMLNGREVSLDGAADLTLLDALRDRFGITSPKDGCQPLGQCGCCTILIDGKPRLSCTMKASMAAGKDVTTLEGLPEETRREIADCFVNAGGVQCGFCIPGIAMRAHALIESNPDPSRQQIANDLRAHLCRCTGYTKIVDAIDVLARHRRGGGNGHSAKPCEGVGGRLGKYGGHDCVLGDHQYIDDITIPQMIHGAMRFSDHPRALVKRIDSSAALWVDNCLTLFNIVFLDELGEPIAGHTGGRPVA